MRTGLLRPGLTVCQKETIVVRYSVKQPTVYKGQVIGSDILYTVNHPDSHPTSKASIYYLRSTVRKDSDYRVELNENAGFKSVTV